MPGIGELGNLAKTYGFTLGFMLFVMLVEAYVIKTLYSNNQALHTKICELLDSRGKFLDSILTEAINGKTPKRNS